MSLKQSNGVSNGPFEKSPLEELSSTITETAGTVSQYLASKNLPQPSLDANGPSVIVPGDAPPKVQVARQKLLSASLQLFQLATGPSEFLPNLATGVSLFNPEHSSISSSQGKVKLEQMKPADSDPLVPIHLLSGLALPIQNFSSCSPRYVD